MDESLEVIVKRDFQKPFLPQENAFTSKRSAIIYHLSLSIKL